MRAPRSPKLVALVAAVALALAACGASGGNDDAQDPTTTQASAEDPTTGDGADDLDDEAIADAQARADSVELTDGDFSEGWSSSPVDDDEDEDEPRPFEDCDPSFRGEGDELASFRMDDYTYGDLQRDDGIQFSAETKVFEDEAAATAALAPFSDDDVIACIDEAFRADGLGESSGNTVEGELAADDYGDTDLDEVAALSGEFTVTTPAGESVDIVLGVAVLRQGDIATQVLFTAVGDALEETSLELPIERLEELLAEA